MLDIAGRMSAGTFTWMTGPKTLQGKIVPRITRAAGEADRPAPRVIAGLPVCVTSDVAAWREANAKRVAFYMNLASYKSMLDQEGVARPIDIGVAGSADQVRDAIGHLASIGVTDLCASLIGSPDEQAETLDLLSAANRP
jgi:alkanesulfonate monooxygenase SsuD/methylene tetrahydromethanopterin reductase-like flavin-dependent oxidoreductase (luciferase family)